MTKLFPYQKQGVRKLEILDGRALLADEMGLGKAQPLSAKVLTPRGWILMGDIQIGDSVIGSKGNPITVNAVHEHGMKKVYRVTFRDGSSTECCEDHLWEVQTALRKSRNAAPLVKSLKEILKEGVLNSSGNARYYIPIVAPINFPHKELPINPYVLGYLIANGSLCYRVGVSIPDQETVTRIKQLLPDQIGLKLRVAIDYQVTKPSNLAKTARNPIKTTLIDLGLFGKHSYDKFIPKIYRYNSVENRILLLQGLMDGDGYAAKDGVAQYTTTSKKLAKQVRELVWSLGGTCTQSSGYPSFTHKGVHKIGRKAYTLTIALPKQVSPFLLSRKADRCPPRTKYQPTRALTKIEYIGEKKCRCITVSAENGLYITDDYIVTHNSIQAIQYAINHPELRPVLVICPASIKWNWENEFRIHFNINAQVLEKKVPRLDWPLSKKGFFVINYDVLDGWMEILLGMKFKLILIDEGHYISTMTTGRTKNVRKLCKGVEHIIVMTGTPMTNRPAELFPILNILDPQEYPSFTAFARMYCAPKRTFWGWDYRGSSNLGHLNERLKGLMIRRLKKDVLDQLPEKTLTVTLVEMSKPKEYKDAERDLVSWLKRTRGKKSTGARETERRTRMIHLKSLVGELKLPAVTHWVKDFLDDTDEKLIVFGVHKKVVRPLQEKFKRISVRVDGSITGRDRQRAFLQFQKDTDTRLFVGNVRAAGTGWNGSVAQCVAFAELDWVPGVMEQAADRPHRIGQKGAVQVVYLIAKDTIEMELCKILQRKSKVIGHAIDGVKESPTLDVMDRLEEVLIQKR